MIAMNPNRKFIQEFSKHEDEEESKDEEFIHIKKKLIYRYNEVVENVKFCYYCIDGCKCRTLAGSWH